MNNNNKLVNTNEVEMMQKWANQNLIIFHSSAQSNIEIWEERFKIQRNSINWSNEKWI